MKTFFAMINIPKAQLKGTASKALSTINTAKKPELAPMAKPEYVTTSEVSKAIVDGFIKTDALGHYARAKAWQAHVKALEAKKFFKASTGTAKPNDGKYCHRFQF